MRKLPPELQAAFLRKIGADQNTRIAAQDYLKWLRYYLDFCAKYQHRPRERDCLQPFLETLASKRQTAVQQEQAAASITHFYDLMDTWNVDDSETAAMSREQQAWEAAYTTLTKIIHLRQYAYALD